MAGRPSHTSTFTSFSKLPPELRNQIWHDTLPERPGPALFRWRRECQTYLRLNAVTSSVDCDLRELGSSHFELPPLLVNREAHAIARSWLQGRRFVHDKQRSSLGLRFDPDRDAMYVPCHLWNGFIDRYHCGGPWNLRYDPVATNPEIAKYMQPIKHLALSETHLREFYGASLAYMLFDRLPCEDIQLLLIVLNQETNPLLGDIDDGRRWEFVSLEGGSFFYSRWNCFKLKGRTRGIYRAEYKRIQAVISDMIPSYDQRRECHMWKLRLKKNIVFEVRPVLAVRR